MTVSENPLKKQTTENNSTKKRKTENSESNSCANFHRLIYESAFEGTLLISVWSLWMKNWTFFPSRKGICAVFEFDWINLCCVFPARCEFMRVFRRVVKICRARKNFVSDCIDICIVTFWSFFDSDVYRVGFCIVCENFVDVVLKNMYYFEILFAVLSTVTNGSNMIHQNVLLLVMCFVVVIVMCSL